MVDEHGRSERRRRVPDVIEREHRKLPTDRIEPPVPVAPAADGDAPLEGFTPDAPDTGYWRGLDSGHKWALAGGIAGGIVLLATLAFAGWYLLSLPGPALAPRPVPASSVPTSESVPSVATTASASASASVAATTGPAPVAHPIVRVPLIAYRAGGSVWVAGEHGGNARSVYPAGAGVFVLSPNGLTLAYIDPSVGTLRLIDVTSGRSTPVGQAIPLRPEWSPDSSFLVYTRPGARGEEVARVEAAGTGARMLLNGWRGRVMQDGKTVIAAPPPSSVSGTTSPVATLTDGRRLVVAARVVSSEVCPAAAGLYYADAGGVAASPGGALSTPSLRWIGYDGKGARTIMAKPVSAAGASFSDLQLSPDGVWLVYAESGDDGYSRLFAIRTAGGAPVPLTPHLDGYFMGWNAAGTELFLVEGNAMQGEATRVSAVHPDGTGRRIVVEGGGL